MREFDVVTGAFGYTGKYITARLLAMGRAVRTLTAHPDRLNPFGGKVSVAPFHFEVAGKLAASLQGADTLYNTYWVRFSHGKVTFDQAVRNTRKLIEAAGTAGVRRLVHISISNPSEDSPLPYFRGKAILERAIAESGLSYAIVRPTVVFGREDILINNIGWLLRRFPVFLIPGSGQYCLQPVFVEDVADIAIAAACAEQNGVWDAAGPEVYVFEELVRAIAAAVRSRARLIRAPAGLVALLCRLLGYFVGDVLLTRDEVKGLMAGLLVSHAAPAGRKKLSEWLAENSETVGAAYASELQRHYR
ncbi:MAG TPA: NAD(P)H-binding protein [Bryobacterales bacterium]|nr:NAD(P)H-binding protein [Bryobacterales bacterium]